MDLIAQSYFAMTTNAKVFYFGEPEVPVFWSPLRKKPPFSLVSRDLVQAVVFPHKLKRRCNNFTESRHETSITTLSRSETVESIRAASFSADGLARREPRRERSDGQRCNWKDGRGKPPTGQRQSAHIHHALNAHHFNDMAVQTPAIPVPSRNGTCYDLR